MSASLQALKAQQDYVQAIVVASAIKPGEWYFNESLMACPSCGQTAHYVTLVVAEDVALDAMALWPEANVRRNEFLDVEQP